MGVTSPLLSDGTKAYTPGVSSRESGVSTFQHSGLKNATDQTSASQSVTASRHYDAFGNLISSSGTWQGTHGYGGGVGYQEDSNGLKLLGHRYYDSDTGRFLSQDPIGDGRNWYTYCENSSIDSYDSNGLKKKKRMVIVIVIGAPYNADGGPDAGYKDCKPLADLYDEKFSGFGWNVGRILVHPSEAELARELNGASGLIAIMHGNDDKNYGRLDGSLKQLASEKLTPDLISKATKGKGLEILILEACHLGNKNNYAAWDRVARDVYAHGDGAYTGRRIEEWGKKGSLFSPHRWRDMLYIDIKNGKVIKG